MKPRITKELQDTLEHNILIDTVYFEVKTGVHHFNHAKETPIMQMKNGKAVPTGKTFLAINGKEVEPMSREDVLKATPDASISEDEQKRNAGAVATAMVEIFENMKKKAAETKA